VRVSFAYDAAADAGQAVALSLSMPLGTPSYAPSRIVPFLEGLLPDSSEVREAWARRFGVSPPNAFALLSHIGRDCAGAVEFVAGDLFDLALDPIGWQVSGERWSLAGAQSKFTLAQLPLGEWRETERATPSTHIIKPGIGEYLHQALVEHVSMQAARAVGLRAATVTQLSD